MKCESGEEFCDTTVIAVAHSIRNKKRRIGEVTVMKPRYIAFLLIGMALLSVLLAACVRPGTEPSSATGSAATQNGNSGVTGSSGPAGGSAVVHMNDSNFVQSSVTIKKGQSVTLTNDAAVPHQIFNGSWVNGTAENKKEPGAPTVQVQFSGSNESHDIGPFNTAGTFNVYCSIHPNMNLTIIVQ